MAGSVYISHDPVWCNRYDCESAAQVRKLIFAVSGPPMQNWWREVNTSYWHKMSEGDALTSASEVAAGRIDLMIATSWVQPHLAISSYIEVQRQLAWGKAIRDAREDVDDA